jgi:hypothetical protein
VDGRKPAAHSSGLARFDEWRSAEVDIVDASENAYGRDDRCTQKADNDDFQMRAAVRIMHRVIHDTFPVSCR